MNSEMHWFKDSKNQLFQHTSDSYGCHVIYSMPFFSSRVVPMPGFRISQLVWDYYMPSGVEHQAVRRGQMSVKGWTFGTSIVAREHLEHVSIIGKRNKKKYWSPRQSCCHHMECTAHSYATCETTMKSTDWITVAYVFLIMDLSHIQ